TSCSRPPPSPPRYVPHNTCHAPGRRLPSTPSSFAKTPSSPTTTPNTPRGMIPPDMSSSQSDPTTQTTGRTAAPTSPATLPTHTTPSALWSTATATSTSRGIIITDPYSLVAASHRDRCSYGPTCR